jgi:hypothetical protein
MGALVTDTVAFLLSMKGSILIGILGGRVQLGPLGIAATNRPIVPAPGDYNDGEIGGMIGRGNRSIRRKPAPVPLCPPQTPTFCPDANPGRRGGKPAINSLNYGTAYEGKQEIVDNSVIILQNYHSYT